VVHAGLDLSRCRLDFCLLDEAGELVAETAAPRDADGLRGLAERLRGDRVRAVIESMAGARFVHGTLEELGWEVLVADAQKVKGLAPLACKTDKIDARVLAELSWRDLVPAIWLPDPAIRRERELARYRVHLVRHRTTLKNRIHATLMTFGHPCPVSDLFGHAGRELLDRFAIPDPWRRNVDASLALIDDLELQIAQLTVELRRQGADHRYIPLLVTAPGFGWINAYTVASEIGDIERFSSPAKLCGYTGLCPRVYQSGASDRRGPISKQGSRYLRWALFEAALHACSHPVYAERYQRTKQRLGRHRGPRSPKSTSPASSPRRSGTCSPATSPSLRQAPIFVSPPDGSLGHAPPERAPIPHGPRR
jgi:transposase